MSLPLPFPNYLLEASKPRPVFVFLIPGAGTDPSIGWYFLFKIFAFTMRDKPHLRAVTSACIAVCCARPRACLLSRFRSICEAAAIYSSHWTQYHYYFRLGYCFNIHCLSSRICLMFTLTREHCGSMLFFPYSLHTLAVHFLSLPSQSGFTSVRFSLEN